jgi:hypothetical protein
MRKTWTLMLVFDFIFLAIGLATANVASIAWALMLILWATMELAKASN